MPTGPISRRRFLKYIAATALTLVAGEIAYRSHRRTGFAQSMAPEARWRVVGDEFQAGEHDATVVQDGKLRLAPGSLSGRYLSPVYATEFAFNAVAGRWQADLPPGTSLTVEIRTSGEGAIWGDWHQLDRLSDGRADPGEGVSNLAIAAGAWLQFRTALVTLDTGSSPSLRELTLTYLDTTAGPSLASWQEARSLALESLDPSASLPSIISRWDWGCPQPDRSPEWPPEYRTVQNIMIHHTVTQNGAEPFATVRAIYQYHAYTLGWDDIGYNYLVDQNGRLYEGRYGGDGVVGGHAFCFNYGSIGIAALGTYGNSTSPPSASVPSQTRQGLVNLIAAKCLRWAVDPAGSGWFINRTLPNVSGHRDANGGCGNGTACPGDNLYGSLAGIRSDAAWQWRELQPTATPSPTPTPTPTPTPRPPSMLLRPSAVYFLADRATQPTPQTVVVANGGDIGFTSQVASPPPPWLQVTRQVMPDGERYSFAVQKSLIAEGQTVAANIVVAPSYNPSATRSVAVTFKYSATPLRRSFMPSIGD